MYISLNCQATIKYNHQKFHKHHTYNFDCNFEIKSMIMKLPSKETIAPYREGCYTHKKPEDCHMLGQFIKMQENDLLKAVKLFKVNCDEYGYAKSCLEYGNVAFTGVKEKNVKSDPLEALKYFEKGCSLGSSENCLNSGMLLVSPVIQNTILQRDLPKGIDYLTKSCEMGNGNACFYLSGMYMSGSMFGVDNTKTPSNTTASEKAANAFALEKDMKKAFAFSTKACELKNFYACANLSQMYAIGDGVEKNLEKSEQFRKKSEELRDEFHRQRILAQFNHP